MYDHNPLFTNAIFFFMVMLLIALPSVDRWCLYLSDFRSTSEYFRLNFVKFFSAIEKAPSFIGIMLTNGHDSPDKDPKQEYKMFR